MRTREELAWAAGFFDGEGCTSAQKYTATLSIAQKATNAEVIHRFRAAVGFGKIYGPYTNSAKSSDISIRYHVTSFEQVQAVIAMLWAWLGTAKKAQYIRVLQKTYIFSIHKGGNHIANRAARAAHRRGEPFVIWSPYHLRLDRCNPRRTTKLIMPPRRLMGLA